MGSCLNFTAKCGTVFLAVLNILTFLLGIGIMVVGILLKEEINKESEILDFLNEVDFGSITLKQIIEIVFVVVIVIGVFAALTSLSGCIGAICKIRVLLIIYVIVLVVCILLELVVLGFWITLVQGTNDALKGEFNDLLTKYAGPSSKDVYSIGWNLIFILGCYDVFQDLFTQLGSIAITVIGLMVLIEGVAIFFSIVITYRETKKSSKIV